MSSATSVALSAQDLAQFTGSQLFFRHALSGGCVYTEGAQYLAEAGSAYWLLDAILCPQPHHPSLRSAEFQVWTLTVAEDRSATLICTDDRYLKAEGVSFEDLIGCVPVDGDTYDVPAIIEVAETRNRVHGLPMPKYGHRLKFGNDPAKHKDFSAVTHVAAGKGIPPFLILHVSAHPDTTAQAVHFGAVLKAAGVPVTVFGAKDTNHVKLNDDLGLPDDPATKALTDFVARCLKR